MPAKKKDLVIEDELTTEAIVEKEEAAPRAYELMIIFNSELLESKMNKRLEELEDFVVKGGGKVIQKDLWGKQGLAYHIGSHKEGIYIVYNFELLPDFVKELNQHLCIDPEILRHMLITVPEGYAYTKYEEEVVVPEPKEKKERPKKNVSIKHTLPVALSKKEEREEIKEDEMKEKKEEPLKEKPQAVDEDALDRKLDEILSDEDLNL